MVVILPPGWRERVRRASARSQAHRALAEQVLSRAEAMLDYGPLVPQDEANGRRLAMARDFSSRVRHGLVALAITGNARFAKMIATDLMQILDLPDWSDVSFLDTAETGMAVCLALDGLGPVLTADQTARALDRLEARVLRRGIASIEGGSRWSRHPGNWAIVGGAAMMVAAAFTKDAALAHKAVQRASGPVHAALAAVGPDGEWPEGVIYRDFAASFAWLASRALAARQQVHVPSDLFDPLLSGDSFRSILTGPTGMIANFGDDLLHAALPVMGPMEFDLPVGAQDPFHLLWGWRRTGEQPTLPRIFIGKYHAVLRDGPDFLALRIGTLPFNDHAHADLAAPIWDHGGKRILADPGRGDYAQPGYFDPVLRLRQSPARETDHNTIALDAQPMADGMRAEAVTEGTGLQITLSSQDRPLWRRSLWFQGPGHLQIEDIALGPMHGGATWTAHLCAEMTDERLTFLDGTVIALDLRDGQRPAFSSWAGGTRLRLSASQVDLAKGIRVGFQLVDTNRLS
jgi:hypothetical protein